MSEAFRKISQEIGSMVSPEKQNEENINDLNQVAQEGMAKQQEQQQEGQQSGGETQGERKASRARKNSKKSLKTAEEGSKPEGGVVEAPAAVGTPVNPEREGAVAGAGEPEVAKEKRRGCCAAFLHRCKHPREKHCCQGNGNAGDAAAQSTSGSVGAGGVPVAGAGTQQ